MSKFPKGNKGMRRKLQREKAIAAVNVKQAMHEASKALDEQQHEIVALHRILISERAQVIFYSDKYLACLRKECVDPGPVNFLTLDESVQEPYVKRAVQELSDAQGIVPHDRDAEQTKQQAQTIAKRIIIPD